MSQFPSHVPVLIIGAGAAGLGASEQARLKGVEHLVVEASHRTGGRGLTEMLGETMPVDLGCHWMHCGSRNPFVAKAKEHGYAFENGGLPYRDFVDGVWKDEAYSAAREAFVDKAGRQAIDANTKGSVASLWDCIDEDSHFAPWATYWLSLMHSNDPDQVAVADLANFADTFEDWPVADGYCALIAACGTAAPVSLNTVVQRIDTRCRRARVETSRGVIEADKVIVTVSTGVLGAGDIAFTPTLPESHITAIGDLPMGNYNYLFYALTPGVIPPEQGSVAYQRDGIATSLRIREFGRPMLSIPVGGRFAWWQESQSEQAIHEWGLEVIADVFGAEARGDVHGFRRSAWGYDKWTRGAYSSSRPDSDEPRKVLMESVDNRLWFAGDAVSVDTFNTAHGAWLSGQRAVDACLA